MDGDDIIVFEEYANKSLDEENIKLDKDVELRLFLIDFKRSAISRFSQLREGIFDVLELSEDGKITYLKKKHDKIGEFEVNIESLKFEFIDNG